jgi:hypothetical protein
MIAHDDIAQELPAVAEHRLLEHFDQSGRPASSRTIFRRACVRAIT